MHSSCFRLSKELALERQEQFALLRLNVRSCVDGFDDKCDVFGSAVVTTQDPPVNKYDENR